MKYIFNTIVRKKFYSIPNSNIYNSTKYHAIVTWNYLDENGRKTNKESDKYCESFFSFVNLQKLVPNIKTLLLGMIIGETKKIKLTKPDRGFNQIQVKLDHFIDIDWNAYCKSINLDNYESIDSICSYLKEESNRFDNELYFVTQSFSIAEIIANSIFYENNIDDLREFTSKYINEVKYLLDKKILEEMNWYSENSDVFEYMWEQLKLKDINYKEPVDVFATDLILFNLSIEEICKREKIKIDEIEWKALALKKLEVQNKGMFFLIFRMFR